MGRRYCACEREHARKEERGEGKHIDRLGEIEMIEKKERSLSEGERVRDGRR